MSRNRGALTLRSALPVVCTIGTTDPTGAAGIGQPMLTSGAAVASVLHAHLGDTPRAG